MWNIHSCLAFSFLLQFAVCHLPVYIPPSPASLIRINHGPSSRSHFHRWQPAAAIIAAPSTKTTYVAPVAKRPPPPPPTTVIHQQVEHEIVAGVPEPFDFGYDVNDEYGNKQFRKESGDTAGVVRGSYGYTDANGLYRIVEYIADANGFRANIKSNEPGLIDPENPGAPADIVLAAQDPPAVVRESIRAIRPASSRWIPTLLRAEASEPVESTSSPEVESNPNL